MTPKFDGCRALVLLDAAGAELERASGESEQVNCSPEEGRGLWVLDAETVDDLHWVFDVLVADSLDVRGLPLPDRLRRIDALGQLPPSLRRKHYEVATCQADLAPLLRRVASRAVSRQRCDGLILVDTIEPYWRPPYKFKTTVTSDFLLESEAQGEGYVLLVGRPGGGVGGGRHPEVGGAALRPLCLGDRPCVLHLSDAQRRRLGVAGMRRLHRSNGVILECRHKGHNFVPLRRRPDRQRPNSATTVEDNLALEAAGCTKIGWLCLALRCAPEHTIFSSWLDALLRSAEASFLADASVVLQVGRLPPRLKGKRGGGPSTLLMGTPRQAPEDESAASTSSFGRFGEARSPRADAVLCLWCLGDYADDLVSFARAVRESEARRLLCVLWRPRPAASLGRFALSAHGSVIALQLAPDPSTRTTRAVDEEALARTLADECGFRRVEDFEGRLTSLRPGDHALDDAYAALAQAVGLLAFVL